MDADRQAQAEMRRKIVEALLKGGSGKGSSTFDPMGLIREPKKPPVTPIMGTRG